MKIGFFGLLTLIFITLKLMGYIAWSWWWVLAPLCAPFVIALAYCGFVTVVMAARVEKFSKKRK